MYISAWEHFVETDERGFMLQQTLERERADGLAVRDSLLSDNEYWRRDFGSRLMTTMGTANAGTRIRYSIVLPHLQCCGACMNSTDASFEAKGILQQLQKPDFEERAKRTESRFGWDAELMEQASTFVKRMNDTKAKLSRGRACIHVYAVVFNARARR